MHDPCLDFIKGVLCVETHPNLRDNTSEDAAPQRKLPQQ